MSVQELNIVFGSKPYSGSDDENLPAHVRKMPAKRRRQWVHVFNSSMSRHHDEGRAFAEANSAVGRKDGL